MVDGFPEQRGDTSANYLVPMPAIGIMLFLFLKNLFILFIYFWLRGSLLLRVGFL